MVTGLIRNVGYTLLPVSQAEGGSFEPDPSSKKRDWFVELLPDKAPEVGYAVTQICGEGGPIDRTEWMGQ